MKLIVAALVANTITSPKTPLTTSKIGALCCALFDV
jgi:hypothetical protein